jgi:hypothetical protein
MIALVLELCGGVCALSTIVFLAEALVRKLMPDFEEELGADLARIQAERFASHLEQSGFIVTTSDWRFEGSAPLNPPPGWPHTAPKNMK